jgi:protein phosphatase
VAISALNYSIGKSVNDPFRTDILSPQEHMETLEKAYHDCNDTVYKLARKREYSGMATTAVSVYLWEEEGGSAGFIIGNVGDSRGYLINRNGIKQVTKDDSEVQKLVDSGEITEREARTHSRKNVITQAIGNKKKITPRTTTHLLENLEYDTVLICSDGVSDRLSNAEIHKIVKKYDNPQDVCDRIAKVINRTNTNHDNISVICIKFPNLLVVD